MQIIIESKDVEITDKLRELIVQKLGTDVDKYLKDFNEDIKTAEVKIEQGSRWGYRVSFSMWLPKKEHIYAEEKNRSLETAINSVKDIVQREVRKYKEKLQDYRG